MPVLRHHNGVLLPSIPPGVPGSCGGGHDARAGCVPAGAQKMSSVRRDDGAALRLTGAYPNRAQARYQADFLSCTWDCVHFGGLLPLRGFDSTILNVYESMGYGTVREGESPMGACEDRQSMLTAVAAAILAAEGNNDPSVVQVVLRALAQRDELMVLAQSILSAALAEGPSDAVQRACHQFLAPSHLKTPVVLQLTQPSWLESKAIIVATVEPEGSMVYDVLAGSPPPVAVASLLWIHVVDGRCSCAVTATPERALQSLRARAPSSISFACCARDWREFQECYQGTTLDALLPRDRCIECRAVCMCTPGLLEALHRHECFADAAFRTESWGVDASSLDPIGHNAVADRLAAPVAKRRRRRRRRPSVAVPADDDRTASGACGQTGGAVRDLTSPGALAALAACERRRDWTARQRADGGSTVV